MKVVSIIPYKILPARLGGEKGIALFNEYLSAEVELTGITTQNNDPALAPAYRLMNILSNSRSRYFNLFLYFTVRKILKDLKASVVIIEHPYYGWLGWLLQTTMKVRLVVHSHNIEYMRSKSIGRSWWRLLKWYESWVYRIADRIFFISDEDRDFAVNNMGTDAGRSLTVTYGIGQSAAPADRPASREKMLRLHQIDPADKILLFNGALYHSTNYDALRIILDEINPLLLATAGFRYKIIVCGKGLPDFFNELRDYHDKNIIYAGFVDDISMYFKAADVFLNPILTGGGVKTKAIEALAMNCHVVSTELGAMGINRDVCGGKLRVVPAGEWTKFRDEIIAVATISQTIPERFFDYYYWGNIVKRAVAAMKNDYLTTY